MTTREDATLKLAKKVGLSNYDQGWNVMDDYIVDFYTLAQNEAYRKAAEVCKSLPTIENGLHRCVTGDVCSSAILALVKE